MATTSHTRPMVVSVWAENVEATAHFYRDVVGLEPIRVHEDDVIRLNMTGGFMAILKGKPRPALDSIRERWPIFALAVDDFDATLSRLEAHGVATPWGIEGSERYSRWVMIHDPAGNLIELVEDHPAGWLAEALMTQGNCILKTTDAHLCGVNLTPLSLTLKLPLQDFPSPKVTWLWSGSSTAKSRIP